MTSESSSLSEALIDLVFDKFSTFVEKYSAQISLGGMYLSTADFKAVGTPVSVEIKLSDGYRLIQAVGEVAWVCSEATAPFAEPGMAIRFQALDESGRGLLLKIIEEQVKGGGEPFDIARPPEGAIVEQGQPEVSAPTAQPAADRNREGEPLWAPEEDIVFDAPWGDKLPDLPDDILDSEPSSAPEKPPAPPLAAAGRRVAQPPAELPAAASDLPDGEDTGDLAAFALPAPDIDFSQPALDQSPTTATPDAEPEPDLDATAPSQRSRQAASPPLLNTPASDTPSADKGSADASLPSLDEPLLGDLPPDFELGDDAGLTFDEDPEEIDFSQDVPPDNASAEGFTLEDEPEATAEAPSGIAEGPAAQPVLPEPELEDLDGPLNPQAFEDPLPAQSEVSPAPSLASDAPATEPPLPEMDSGPAPPPEPISPPASSSFLNEPSTATAAPNVTERPEPTGLFSDHAEEPGSATDEPFADHGVEPELPELDEDETADRPRRPIALIAAAAVLLAVIGGVAYLQRDTLLGWLGLGSPPLTPPAASPPGVAAPDRAPTAAPEDASEPIRDDVALNGLEPAGDSPPVVASSSTTSSATSASDPPPESTPSRPASRIQNIIWRSSQNGTKIIIQADGNLSQQRLQQSRLTTPPIREILRISQILEPYLENRIEVGTAELSQIRLGHHPEGATAELHIVLDLTAAEVELTAVDFQGDRLEVMLSKP